MAKALYRKYRPRSLSGVVGQEQVTKVLANSIKQNKISHAYLFIGPRGTGKTSVARIFAHEINNFSYELEDDYVDIIEIDGASNRGIDDIRELREKALIAPTSGKYKVYIIDEVHMLTKEAFNALLKILEEPPKHIVFIMATTDAHKVPATITSRAQIYTFKLANQEIMLNFLESVAEKEGMKIDRDALSIIVKRGGGSFRDSLSLLDQISTLSEDLITKELVISSLGLPNDEKISELLDARASGDVVKITTVLKDLLSSGIKPETLTEEIISFIIDNPNPEYFTLLEKLPEVKAPFAEAKLLVALTQNLTVFSRPAPVAANGLKKTPSPASNIEISDAPQKTSSPAFDIEDSSSVDAFNWEEFLARVKEKSGVIYSQLLKTSHEFKNGVLEIYPENKFAKNTLSKESNKRILVDEAGTQVVINDVGKNQEKDEILAKISDIMGGKVKNDGGENPF